MIFILLVLCILSIVLYLVVYKKGTVGPSTAAAPVVESTQRTEPVVNTKVPTSGSDSARSASRGDESSTVAGVGITKQSQHGAIGHTTPLSEPVSKASGQRPPTVKAAVDVLVQSPQQIPLSTVSAAKDTPIRQPEVTAAQGPASETLVQSIPTIHAAPPLVQSSGDSGTSGFEAKIQATVRDTGPSPSVQEVGQHGPPPSSIPPKGVNPQAGPDPMPPPQAPAKIVSPPVDPIEENRRRSFVRLAELRPDESNQINDNVRNMLFKINESCFTDALTRIGALAGGSGASASVPYVILQIKKDGPTTMTKTEKELRKSLKIHLDKGNSNMCRLARFKFKDGVGSPLIFHDYTPYVGEYAPQYNPLTHVIDGTRCEWKECYCETRESAFRMDALKYVSILVPQK